MFGSVILEVGIGLALVYLVVSTLCSAVNEWIARIFALRAKTLQSGIGRLLNDDNFRKEIYNHPLIKGLSRKGWWERQIGRLAKKGDSSSGDKNSPETKYGPSNLSSGGFAQVLVDLVKNTGQNSDKGPSIPEGQQATAFQMVKIIDAGIKELDDNNQLKQILRVFLDSARTETSKPQAVLAEFRTSIEEWFDDAMDRISGWYKRKAQLIILCLAIIICFALNIDTFTIANGLYQDANLRESVVAAAEVRAQQSAPEDNQTDADISEIREELSGLGLPIGWTAEKNNPRSLPVSFPGWLVKILGILFTAFAVALGAPFWFDLLNRFVNLRNSGKTPEKTAKTSPTALTTGKQ